MSFPIYKYCIYKYIYSKAYKTSNSESTNNILLAKYYNNSLPSLQLNKIITSWLGPIFYTNKQAVNLNIINNNYSSRILIIAPQIEKIGTITQLDKNCLLLNHNNRLYYLLKSSYKAIQLGTFKLNLFVEDQDRFFYILHRLKT